MYVHKLGIFITDLKCPNLTYSLQVLNLRFSLRIINHLVLRTKFHANAVDTVSLICWRSISLALKDMSKMSATVTADDFCPSHAESAVSVSGYSSGDIVKVGRPSTARFELMRCLVERSITRGAGVDSIAGHVFVVSARARSFSSLFA